jgi:uncharacterized membrane-anchored protein YitT (DUF2179 family)
MNRWYGKIKLTWLKQVLWNLFLISLGSVLCAIAVNGILIPQKFLSAGFTGLALGLHYLVPHLPVSWLYLLLNIPLFILGRKHVGHRFFLYSIAGVVVYSLALKWILFIPGIHDKILSALLAGIIMGTGAGLILRSLGSGGGLDILSVIMRQRFSIRLGTTSLAFNTIILTGAAFLISLDGALYTLIYVYVTSYMLNLVVTGLSQRKAVFIISSQWENISRRIIRDLNRGVTHLRGEGGFTGQEEMILYTVIAFQELSRLKRIIRQADPNAFVVVTETLEVMGKRIGNQPHW